MTITVESIGCANGTGWVIASLGRRCWRWSFPAKSEAEFKFWSELVLDALRRLA